MSEFMFVIKGLFIAVMITICMQMKVGHAPLETHFMSWVETSAVPVYLQGVATGAVVAIKNAGKAGSEFLGQTFGKTSETQNASRFNINFKRSPKAEKPASEQPASED